MHCMKMDRHVKPFWGSKCVGCQQHVTDMSPTGHDMHNTAVEETGAVPATSIDRAIQFKSKHWKQDERKEITNSLSLTITINTITLDCFSQVSSCCFLLLLPRRCCVVWLRMYSQSVRLSASFILMHFLRQLACYSMRHGHLKIGSF